MDDMRLPVTAEGVTAQWLSEALQFRFPGVSARDVRVVDIDNGTSTKIRIAVEYDAAGKAAGLPARLMVKGGFEAHSPPMEAMYRREARFYADVLPYIDMPSPRCFYAGSDPGSHQSIVVLEDLCERGVRFCSALVAQSYDEAARRLSAMARYHAESWNSPELLPEGRFGWLDGRFEGFGLVHNRRYFQPDVWKRMCATPRGAAVSVQFHDFDWVVQALEALGALHRASPVRSLLHGDAHPGNMYIEADGAPGFLDAQVIRGPWHYDVTKYLVCSLDMPDRRAWEKKLLAHYLRALEELGVTPPSLDEAFELHRREICYSLAMFIINETAFQTEPINTAYTARCSVAALELGTKEAMAALF